MARFTCISGCGITSGDRVPTEFQYDKLLVDLYAGCTDRQGMSGFMRALGELTGSHITTLVHADLDNPSASSLLTIGAGPNEILSWSEHAGDNPWMQRYLPEIHAGGVCNGDAYLTRKELLASLYYDGFLRHIDTQHSLGICAAHEQSRAAFLMLCRSGRAGAYEEDCLQLFQRLAPHLVNAFALQAQFEYVDAQAVQLAHRQRGLFLLDAAWNWIGGNDAAEDIVAAGWWRGRRGTRLLAAHPATRSAWQALQRLAGQGGMPLQVIPVHDPVGQLVAFASVHQHSANAIGKQMPRYAMFVRPLKPAPLEPLASHLRQLFALTGAESSLVLALRVHGDMLLASKALGIAGSSARTRLQSIYEKTGMHRQADLMMMIDALAETVA